jgi:hypothetical protein
MNRAQKLLASTGGRVPDFVQMDTLKINIKYLILSATHHVTQFGAETVLLIWDNLNKRCLNVFWPRNHVQQRFTSTDLTAINPVTNRHFLVYRGIGRILWRTYYNVIIVKEGENISL